MTKTLTTRKHSLSSFDSVLHFLHCVLFRAHQTLMSSRWEAYYSCFIALLQTWSSQRLAGLVMRRCGSPSRMKQRRQKKITVWSRSSWHQRARCRPRGEAPEKDRIAWVSFELSVWQETNLDVSVTFWIKWFHFKHVILLNLWKDSCPEHL